MQAIYDADGNELGSIALTEKQQAILDNGGVLSVLYHTPQLLQHLLGKRSGSFALHKDGDRLKTLTLDATKEFLQLQAAIKAAREPN